MILKSHWIVRWRAAVAAALCFGFWPQRSSLHAAPVDFLQKAGDLVVSVGTVAEQVGAGSKQVREASLAGLTDLLGQGASSFDPDALQLGRAVLSSDAAAGLADKIRSSADQLGGIARPLLDALQVIDVGKTLYQCIEAGATGDRGKFTQVFNGLVRDQIVQTAKQLGGKGGAYIGGTVGAAAGPLAILTGAVGYFAGGFLAETGAEFVYDQFLSDWVSEQVASRLYDTIFQRGGLPVSQSSPPSQSPRARDLALALVVDRSGSMASADKLPQAIQAAVSLLRSLSVRDRIAIVAFSSSAETIYPLGPARREEARRAVDALTPDGNTAIGLGLLAGLNELSSAQGHKRVILLMTDGENNEAEQALDESLRRAEREGIPIMTVGFGLQAGRDLLQIIAQRTGGVFTTADSGSLAQTYMHLRSIARNDTDLALVRGVIRQGQTRAHQIHVPPGSSDLQGTLTWQGSRMSLRLIPPNGRTINAATASGLPGVTFDEMPSHHLVSVNVASPVPGPWQVVATGDEIPPAGEIYTFSAAAQTPLEARALPLPAFVTSGERVRLGATTAIQGATVTGSIWQGKKARVLPLNDFGQSGDSVAGDRVFSCEVPVSLPTGIYPVSYTVQAGARSLTIWASLQVGNAADILRSPSMRSTLVESALPFWMPAAFLAVALGISVATGLSLLFWFERKSA